MQLQKPLSVMMKLALMRTTATGKEDPELPLLQRISSLELPASDCNPNKCFTNFKKQTHLNLNCSEDTA
jgi:hypothetical protein